MKKSKVLLITFIIVLVIGIAFFITGGILSGWDIKWWFTSKWGYMTYIALGAWVLAFLVLYVPDWIRRL